jgi:prepilin signal peptidase PulO-like enzyme (type II secretory pathway)
MSLDLSHPNLTLDVLSFVIGLCIGSFLNVVALRSLAEISIIWPPSRCPKCLHPLSPLDNIPLLSYLMLQGRCRYCATGISWQYPVVEFCTGLIFVAIERVFLGWPASPLNIPYWNNILETFNPTGIPGAHNVPLDFAGLGAWPFIFGAVILACTLIAVTVTDFREKLIPHEITYPSMIIGLCFSAIVRHDLLGALAGVGASYMLFDFIAFYGLKVYLMMHGGTEDEPAGRKTRLRRRVAPRARRRMGRGLRWRLDLASIDRSTTGMEEPMEVMGGGDAVLSAVMAAYLGWQLLVLALLIGFVIGTIMGMGLLMREMAKAKLLHNCGLKAIIFGVIGATVFGGLGMLFPVEGLEAHIAVATPMALLGLGGGAMIAVVSVGTQVSKPYPFGPALAMGGLIAMFLLPNWISMAPPLH